MAATESHGEHGIKLSKAETLLIQAFKKLVYDYHVRAFSVNATETQSSPSFVSEDLPEYQGLCQLAYPYLEAHSTRVRALFSVTKYLCENNIPGNFVEYGPVNDISSIILAYVIKQYSRTPRLLYVLPPSPGNTKLTQPHDNLHQEIPHDMAQEIWAKLEIADIMTTTSTEYQSIIKRSPGIMGMISFVHCNDLFRSFCLEQICRLKCQLISHAFVQVDGGCSQDQRREYVDCLSCSVGAEVVEDNLGENFTWFQIPDVRDENPTLPKSAIECFQKDEQKLGPLVSQMSLNERFQLHHLLSTPSLQDTDIVRFVEIGSYSGHSLLLSYLALKRRFQRVQGFAIEPHGTAQFYNSIQRYPGDIIHLRMYSDQAVSLLRQRFERDNIFPSFIFVDGNHRYEHVRRDIINYLPLLAPGGLIVFHDYLPPFSAQNREAILIQHAGKEPGVRQACTELIETTGQYQVLDLPLLYPNDLTQTQAQLPLIPGVQSTLRAYKKCL